MGCSSGFYTRAFYTKRAAHKAQSARQILSWLFQQLGGAPESLVDFGCGVGTWLNAAKDQGVREALGFDGKWIMEKSVRLGPGEFRYENLETTIELEHPFAMAMSLEVAEHLDARHAATHVHNLTRAADRVLFSAAIPGQGGTHHVNEQWPGYWAERFHEEGFRCFDTVRPRFWNDAAIPYWYRQNTFLFANQSAISASPWLQKLAENPAKPPQSLVHPELWQQRPFAQTQRRWQQLKGEARSRLLRR